MFALSLLLFGLLHGASTYGWRAILLLIGRLWFTTQFGLMAERHEWAVL